MTECKGLAGVAGHSNKALMTYPSGCRIFMYLAVIYHPWQRQVLQRQPYIKNKFCLCQALERALN